MVIKLYLQQGLCRKEASQLEVLGRYSLLSMPRVYFRHTAGDDGDMDALLMEYLPGINAGIQEGLPQEDREHIAWQVVENLIGWHRVVNPKGFGEIGAAQWATDGQDFYYPKAKGILHKAQTLREWGWLAGELYDVMHRAMGGFSAVFHEPIKTARLIHGDYNMWNVMLSQERKVVSAVIDPFGCCWGDSEMDLYQLDNANGLQFGLLDKYRERMPVSERFQAKRNFYEVFSEVMHFHDAQVNPEGSNLPQQIRRLAQELERLE